MSEQDELPNLDGRVSYDLQLFEYTPKKMTLDWAPVEDSLFSEASQRPYEPFLADRDKFNGEFHFIGRDSCSQGPDRFSISGFIGPIIKGKGLLRTPFEEGAESLCNYEVLVTNQEHLCWRSLRPDGTLPVRAALALNEKSSKVYIGKKDRIGVGSVKFCQSEFKWKFYSHERAEPYTAHFKILCFI